MSGETSGTNSGATGAGGASRAVDAALSAASPFRPRASTSVLRASDRHIERWTPERDATRRSGSLRSLAFADRVLGPYAERAGNAGILSMFGGDSDATYERDVEPTSWIFPRPWYLDELSWLAAARAAGTAAVRPAARRSSTSTGAVSAAGAPVRRSAARPVGASTGRGETSAAGAPTVPLELVAPSMAPRRRRHERGGDSPRPHAPAVPAGPGMRAWSPLVSFSAIEAAEVMTAAVASTAAGDTRERPLSAESRMVLEYVSPGDVSETARGPAVAQSARNRLESAMRRAQERRAAREALAGEAPAPAGSAPAARSGAQAPGGQGTDAASKPGPKQAPASALDLLHRAAVAGAMAPVTGPRLALPSGLGGLVAGVRAQRAVSRPVLRAAGGGGSRGARLAAARRPVVAPGRGAEAPSAEAQARGAHADTAGQRSGSDGSRDTSWEDALVAPGAWPERPGPASAFRAVTGARPTAMRHIAWSDRWLARFAGASTGTLASLDAITQGPSLQLLAAGAPSPVFIAGESAPQEARRGEPAPLILGSSVPPLVSRAGRPELAAAGPRATSAPGPVQRAPRTGSAEPRAAQSAGQAPEPSSTDRGQPGAPMPAAPRIDDGEAVPDEVFAAIAAAAARPAPRDARRDRSRQPRSADSAARYADGTREAGRAAQGAGSGAPASKSFVDRLLEFGPVAPGPGMRAALAASPVAPALHAVMPLPATAGFDVRAIHGSELAHAYLAGRVEPSMEFVGSAQSAGAMRAALASVFSSAGGLSGGLASRLAGSARLEEATLASLAAMAPVSELVAPFESRGGSAGDTRRPGEPSAGRQGSPLAGAPQDAPRAAAALPPSGAQSAASPAASPPSSGAAAESALQYEPVVLDVPGPLLPTAENRAAQLAALSPLSRTAAVAAATSSALSTATLGTTTAAAMSGASYTYGLGQAGVRAEAWSAGQERQVADLAFDFVQPELLMAARAYGFGPAEAAQAARLATSGRRDLASLATAVDLTFIEAYQKAQSRTSEREAKRAVAAEAGAAEAGAAEAGAAEAGGTLAAQQEARGAAPAGPAGAEQPASSLPQSAPGLDKLATLPALLKRHALFGLPRRGPRGVFLWPQAAASALELHPENADERQPLSLAALDVLAAKAVADVGIFVAPDGTPLSAGASAAANQGTRAATAGAPDAAAWMKELVSPPHADSGEEFEAPSPGATPVDPVSGSAAGSAALGAKMGPMPRSFEALYAALSSSPAGRSLSPAVRAARALALANSMGGSVTPARARAAAAWAVMPMVIPGELPPPTDGAGPAALSPGGSAGAATAPTTSSSQGIPGPVVSGDTSPRGTVPGPVVSGLERIVEPGAAGGVSGSEGASRASEDGPSQRASELRLAASRAGESLRSFVTPHVEQPAGAATSRTPSRPQGAVHRAPTAAQPLVDTGGSTSSPVSEMIRAAKAKRASGEVAIPEWFEKAARQMFDSSSNSGGITLAEMTLVTAAPARHVAASPKTASSGPASAPESPAATESSSDQQPAPEEVQRLAEEVYAEICRLMEIARERNGEPWR